MTPKTLDMEATKNYIAELDTTKRDWTITARVTRMWEVRYKPTNPTPDTIDMVLLDEQGSQIQALVKKAIVSHFKDRLQEGRIYTTTHFNVGKNNRTRLQVENEYIIWFTSFTSVTLQEESSAAIPFHKFNLRPIDDLSERTNKIDVLTEVIGQLIGVENKITQNHDNNTDQRRTIHIQDERTNKIAVTLWGQQADLVADDVAENGAQPKIVIITATRVTMFKGNYQLNSTGGTKLYINLEIPEVENFKKNMTDVPLQEILHIEVTQPESLEEAMTKNRKTITELQQIYMEGEENQEAKNTYTCVAKIATIHDQECGWMYTSCNNCKSKIDENQYCNKCEDVPEFPIDRY
ncbi:replication protein A 70 kDa DNA-binding subunit B-like isoform X1 [Spinacia oleracea]|uniref:Replication protein A 70 kDa DNA-binding subunit B-like isoform X1 n=1 Tax=Spinacia oleracea TaxID=3562 RepID=A0ABM3QMU9_SPIOL|nr:replication protein A 70 kDa DNA-binding subunit B-like isoform X1 [Spinacia oleracea]